MPRQKWGLKTHRACRPFPILLGNGHLHTPRHGVCWPYPGRALFHFIRYCPVTDKSVFFSKTFPTKPNPNSSGVLLVRVPDFCSCPELPPHPAPKRSTTRALRALVLLQGVWRLVRLSCGGSTYRAGTSPAAGLACRRLSQCSRLLWHNTCRENRGEKGKLCRGKPQLQ